MAWLALGEYHGPARAHVFVNYLSARWMDRLRETSYRVYVTDSLQSIPQMQYKSVRWAVAAGVFEEEEEPSADEIIDGVISRLGV